VAFDRLKDSAHERDKPSGAEARLGVSRNA